MANNYCTDVLKLITGQTYYYEIQHYNYWVKEILGGTGGHTYIINALNEICGLVGAAQGHTYNIDALNAIAIAYGGTGGNEYEYDALVEVQNGSLLKLPDAPTGLTLSVISDTQINLSWTDNSDNEDSFDVYRSTNGTDFTLVHQTAADATSWNNTGLTEGTRYYYKVCATNGSGSSAFTDTKDDYTIPLAPSALTANADTDVAINLAWTKNTTNGTICIERSTDGINYTEIDTSTGTTYASGSLTEDTRYYYRLRSKVGTATYSAYCTAAYDYTYYAFTLTSTGTGAGVSTLRFTTSADQTVKLTGTAKFYSNSGGTANESATWSLTTGALRTIYLKCPSSTAKLLVKVRSIIQWGDASNAGWPYLSNAPTCSGDLSKFTGGITTINYDSVVLTGSLTNLTSLTYLNAQGSNTISGSITNLTSLTYLNVGGNSLTGSVENLTSLSYLSIGSNTTISGSITNLTSLTYLNAQGGSTLTGSVTNLKNLTYLNARFTNSLTGDLGGNGTNATAYGLILINLLNCLMSDYTSGATWSLTQSSNISPANGYGYSATEIDNILIDMAASLGTVTAKTIELKGSSAARTSASDAAVSTLNGKGWTIATN